MIEELTFEGTPKEVSRLLKKIPGLRYYVLRRRLRPKHYRFNFRGYSQEETEELMKTFMNRNRRFHPICITAQSSDDTVTATVTLF